MTDSTYADNLQQTVLNADPSSIPDGATLGRSLAFNAQCFLITNIHNIKKHNSSFMNPQGDGWKTAYKNITTLSSDDTYPPAELFSALQHRDENEGFLNLTPDQMALLVPKIRIYKVDFDNTSGDTQPAQKQDPVEIIFDDYIHSEDLKTITMTASGRSRGVGIKKFIWKLAGTQPAEVDYNIEAELEIFFSSVKDIFSLKSGQIVRQAGIDGKGSFLDLIIHSPGSKKHQPVNKSMGCSERIYDGNAFTIKAVVGWAVPNGSSSLFTSTELAAVRANQTVMYLQLTNHKFDFKQDGTATLVANYRARYALEDTRYNILKPENAEDIERLRKLKTQQQNLSGDGDTAVNQTDTAQDNQQAVDTEIAKVLSTRYTRINKALLDKVYVAYARPIDLNIVAAPGSIAATAAAVQDALQTGVAGGSAIATGQAAQRLRSQVIGAADGTGPAVDDLTTAATAAQDFAGFGPQGPQSSYLAGAQSATAAAQDAAAQRTAVRASSAKFYKTELDRVKKAIDDSKAPPADPDDATTPADPDTRDTNPNNTAVTIRDGEVMIPVKFVFLGEILDILIGIACRNEIKNASVGFILGDMEYVDPQSYIKQSEQYTSGHRKYAERYLCGIPASERAKILERVNIANIPIALDRWQDFFIEKVIKPKLENYFLESAIRDILNELIRPVLGEGCVDLVPPLDTSIGYTEFVGDQRGSKPWIPPGFRLTVSRLKSITPGAAGGVKALPLSPLGLHTTYKYLYMSSVDPSYMRGDQAKDFSRGIYHFNIGQNGGLVKRVTFERMDQPYMREARVQRVGALGAEQLRELYNVNLVMYGHNLLKPGQFIFVNPTSVGLGGFGTDSLTRLLGIGGYHLVTDIKSTLGPNGFETRVKALHQAMPFDGDVEPASARQSAALDILLDRAHPGIQSGDGKSSTVDGHIFDRETEGQFSSIENPDNFTKGWDNDE